MAKYDINHERTIRQYRLTKRKTNWGAIFGWGVMIIIALALIGAVTGG